MMDKEERKKPRVLPEEPRIAPIDPVIAAESMLQQDDNIVTDILGSYTGLGTDGDTPVQDADDL